MIRLFHRLLKMPDDRLTKKIFKWDRHLNSESQVCPWYSEVKHILNETNFPNIHETGSLFPLKKTIGAIEASLKLIQNDKLKHECLIMPKLRTFNCFKKFNETPHYLLRPLSFFKRKAMANLRLGTLKLRVETLRFLRPKVPFVDRVCIVCDNVNGDVEDEVHFLMHCNAYSDLRCDLLNSIKKSESFESLDVDSKLDLLLNVPENVNYAATFILKALDLRSKILF